MKWKSSLVNNTIKVLILGQSCIGKTHLINAMIQNESVYQYRPTNGIDCTSLIHENKLIKFYDAGGEKRIEPIIEQYYKTADIIVLAFSFNDINSFSVLEKLHEQSKTKNPKAHIILLGLQEKSPIKNIKQISQTVIKEFMNRNEINLFCACDSKEAHGLLNVKELLIYYSQLEEKLKAPPITRNEFSHLWHPSMPAVNNIKAVILNALNANRFSFFSFQERQYKKALMTILNDCLEPNDSLTSARVLLDRIEMFNSNHANRLNRQIDFIKHQLDKLHILRAIEPKTTHTNPCQHSAMLA